MKNLELARGDTALQEALRVSSEMAAIALEDEAREVRARWAARLEPDAGDVAAAALFTASSHFGELLLSLLAQHATDGRTDQLAALQRFAIQPPGLGSGAPHGLRAAELYQQHIADLCGHARGVLGGLGE